MLAQRKKETYLKRLEAMCVDKRGVLEQYRRQRAAAVIQVHGVGARGQGWGGRAGRVWAGVRWGAVMEGKCWECFIVQYQARSNAKGVDGQAWPFCWRS